MSQTRDKAKKAAGGRFSRNLEPGALVSHVLSQGTEEQVSVDVLQAVPPVEHPVAAGDLLHPLQDQAGDRPKISKQQGKTRKHLLFRLGKVAGIYVSSLEGGKQQLARGRVVAVAAREQHGDGMVLEELQHLGALVVGGVVQHQVVGASPVGPLRVQLHDQVLEEEHHGAAVGVRLQQ